MKKKITVFLIWFFFIVLFLLPFLLAGSLLFEDSSLNPNDYARITDVEYKAVVVDEPESEGKVVITERLTFDVHAASKRNPFWELWRDLPEDYVDGVKVDYKVNSVKQILPDGTEVVYTESPRLYWDDFDYTDTYYGYGPGKWYHSEGPYNESAAQYECVFFYIDGVYREEMVFEIEYEMYNAALRYNDCSDLYLSMYSEDSIRYLDSYKAEILFPNADMPSQGNYEVYTYGTNADSFPVYESADMNPGYYTFYFELDEDDLQFKPYNEFIEFDLVSYGDDRHIFTEYAPSNYYSSDNVLDEIREEQRDYADTPEHYRAVKLLTAYVFIGIAAFVLAYTFTAGLRAKSKHTFYQPSVDSSCYRGIPGNLDPNFAAALVFAKHKAPKDDSGIYSALLLSLARKRYITIRQISDDNIEIILNRQNVLDSYEPLTICERYYFDLLVRHSAGNSITMKTLQERISSDYENSAAFAKNMENSIVNIGIKEGYFQKADYTQPKRRMRSFANFLMVIGILFIAPVNMISCHTRLDFAFGAFFIFGISCVAGSLYLKKESGNYILLTQFGENEYAKWRGLYNFLNTDALMRERTVADLPLYEQYFIYATAFGISEKVIEAIGIRCPEAASSPILGSHYYRSPRFRHHSRAFRSAVYSGSHGGYSGGGSGGGFGYGGGGRGGGGGGGGH